MPATDVVQRFVEATVGILRANTTLQGLLGRTTQMVVPWDSIDAPPLPVLAYAIISVVNGGPVGDTRRIAVQFTALAEGDGSQATCNAILEAVELGLTQPLFAGASLDAAPIPGRGMRYNLTTENRREGPRNLARADVDMEFMVTK